MIQTADFQRFWDVLALGKQEPKPESLHKGGAMGLKKPRRVVVADAHLLERLGILAVLKQAFSCAQFCVAADLGELVGLIDEGVEIVVVDADLPGLTSFEQLRQLKLTQAATKFVLVSPTCSPSTVFAGLTAGAQGVIDKTLGTVEMVQAFRLVWMGHVYVPRHICDGRALTDLTLAGAEPSPTKPLSMRQRQVLELACAGISNKEIARKLAIAEATVKVHVGAAFRAIGVTNRTHAAAVFRNHPAWLQGENTDGGSLAVGEQLALYTTGTKTGLSTVN